MMSVRCSGEHDDGEPCGNVVSDLYARVFGVDGRVRGCPACRSVEDRAAGAVADPTRSAITGTTGMPISQLTKTPSRNSNADGGTADD